MNTDTVILEPWQGLEGLRQALPLHDALQGDRPASLCNRSDWIECHASAYTDSETIFGWTARDKSGAAIGVLPFRIEPSRGTFALPRAILVHDGTFESDYIELALLPGLEEQILSTTFDALRGKPGVEAVVLGPLAPNSPTLRACEALVSERHLPARKHALGCATAPLPATFDDYLKTLKKRMRSKVRSALRKSEEGGATFHWCDTPDELPAHLEGLYKLHAMRWNEVGEEGSFTDPGRLRFYAELIPRLLKAGVLRFARLDLAGEAIAYQIGAVCGGSYYQLQEGYDTAHADLRAGVALRGRFVQALIDEGVETYDFMGGLSRHKSDWGGQELECQTLAFPAGGLRARAAYALRAFADARQRD